MQEQLLILKETICTMINRGKTAAPEVQKLLSDEERQQLVEAVQRIRHDLLQAAFFRDPLCRPFLMHSLDSVLAITRRLHKAHDELFRDMLAGELCPLSRELYEIEMELTHLFAWILKTFPDDLEPSQPLPPLFRSENFSHIQAYEATARTNLEKKKLPAELINIVLQPFCIFTGRDRVIIYRDFKYVYFYKKALTKLLRSQKVDTEKVRHFLHLQRNNTLAFLNWQVAIARENASLRRYRYGEIMAYMDELRILNDYIIPPGDQLTDRGSSVSMYRNWLEAEKDYAMNKYVYTDIEKHEKAAAEKRESADKIETVLSVPELACFFRLLFENGLLVAENPAEVMRLIANSFRTARTVSISEGSLLNKYWGIEQATHAKVKNRLMQMLNAMREPGWPGKKAV